MKNMIFLLLVFFGISDAEFLHAGYLLKKSTAGWYYVAEQDANSCFYPDGQRVSCPIGGVTVASFLMHGQSVDPAVVFLEGIDFEEAENEVVLLESLREAYLVKPFTYQGYKLVTVNFTMSKEDIFLNALYVKEILRYLSYLQRGYGKLKVIGFSMGGLVGREAVYQYTKETSGSSFYCPINFYLSFDSPHQGANIPSSVAKQFYFWRNDAFSSRLGDSYEMIQQFSKTLMNSPATSQMGLLAFRDKEICPEYDAENPPEIQCYNDLVIEENPIEHQEFQAVYEAHRLQIPNSVRQVAISNGSSNGSQQQLIPTVRTSVVGDYDPGIVSERGKAISSVLGWNGAAYSLNHWWNADFSIGRMLAVRFGQTMTWDGNWGDRKDNTGGAIAYFKSGAFGALSLHSLPFSTSNRTTSYDLAPGGFFPFYDLMYDKFFHGFKKTVPHKIFSAGGRDLHEGDEVGSLPMIRVGQACFIPTVSALDYRMPDGTYAINDRNYVYGNLEANGLLTSHTTFDQVYAVGSDDASNSALGFANGFYKNQYHVTGKSTKNSWRIACEIFKVDNKISAAVNCDDLTAAPSWYQSGFGAMTSIHPDPGMYLDNKVVYALKNDALVWDDILDYADIQVHEGIPQGGYYAVQKLLVEEWSDRLELDVKIPSGQYGWGSLTLILKRSGDGCGWIEVGSLPLDRNSGEWKKYGWNIPQSELSQRDKQSCNDDPLAGEWEASVILNMGDPKDPVLGRMRMTSMRFAGGSAVEAIKPSPKNWTGTIWAAEMNGKTPFDFGAWGDVAKTSEGADILFSSPWSGTVLYSNKVLSTAGYSYLELEYKVDLVLKGTQIIAFFDDKPLVVDGAESLGYSLEFGGMPRFLFNPYGKRYNYIGGGILSRKEDANGFVVMRYPLAWLGSPATISKFVLQKTNWDSYQAFYKWVPESIFLKSVRLVP